MTPLDWFVVVLVMFGFLVGVIVGLMWSGDPHKESHHD